MTEEDWRLLAHDRDMAIFDLRTSWNSLRAERDSLARRLAEAESILREIGNGRAEFKQVPVPGGIHKLTVVVLSIEAWRDWQARIAKMLGEAT